MMMEMRNAISDLDNPWIDFEKLQSTKNMIQKAENAIISLL